MSHHAARARFDYSPVWILLALVLAAWLADHLPGEPGSPEAAKPEPGVVSVRFADGSAFRLTLRDEHVDFVTPYGEVKVPVKEIQRIQFATRTPDDMVRRIDAAIADLGNPQSSRREAATAELLKLREKAYSALLRTAKQADAELARHAKELAAKIRETAGEQVTALRTHDVIYTEHSKLAGRIKSDTLKGATSQFGHVNLRLSDMESLSLSGHEEDGEATALQQVEVEWSGKWWPAQVLKTKDGMSYIRYAGFDDQWNEWVGKDRIRRPARTPTRRGFSTAPKREVLFKHAEK